MSFSGVEFSFFLPLALLIHWLLPRRASAQNAFLLAASYLFYASWTPRLLPLLVAATAVDYFAALYIDRHRDAPNKMRLGLAVSLVYNLGQLGYFKYAGFFAASFNALLSRFGLGAPLPVLQVMLPLGISFFTFQKLAYVIDVYWDRQAPCRSPLRFATFVAFFPQLIAGPIVRAGELLPQLEQPRRPDADRFAAGAAIFLLGYFKKAFVADYLGQFLVDPIFAHHGDYSTAGHWLALVAYAVQVFCDFSGYSEMAIGCGRLLGIELPQNFNYPFLSKSLIEFWRRWHITLNTWLFDYIYNPLVTGEGFFRGRLDLGFVVVFLASGLWHGARWTFVLWGALHGLGLVAHRRWDEFYKSLCRKDRGYVALRKSSRYVAAAWFATQFFFLLTLIPFRAPSLGVAGSFARALVVPHPGLRFPSTGLPPLFGLCVPLCGAFIIGYHLLALSPLRGARERFLALPGPLRGACYGLVVAFLLLFVPVGSGAFIYAQF